MCCLQTISATLSPTTSNYGARVCWRGKALTGNLPQCDVAARMPASTCVITIVCVCLCVWQGCDSVDFFKVLSITLRAARVDKSVVSPPPHLLTSPQSARPRAESPDCIKQMDVAETAGKVSSCLSDRCCRPAAVAAASSLLQHPHVYV